MLADMLSSVLGWVIRVRVDDPGTGSHGVRLSGQDCSVDRKAETVNVLVGGASLSRLTSMMYTRSEVGRANH